MTVNSVSLNGMTFTSLEQIQQARKDGTITRKQARELKNQFKTQAKNPDAGTKVESSNAQPLNAEQRAAKQAANQSAIDEVAAMKARTQAVKKDGLSTKEGVITSYGNNAYTYDIKAPSETMKKTTKAEIREEFARYYDKETGEWITGKENLKAKRQELKGLRKDAKKAEKELEKQYMKAEEELSELEARFRLGEVSKDAVLQKRVEVAELFAKAQQAASDFGDYKESYQQVKQAHRASQKTSFLHNTGIGSVKRARNANVKANNRLINTEVVYDKVAQDELKNNPAYKDVDVNLATKEDINVLNKLYNAAQKHVGENSSPEERALWSELGNMFNDEEGNPLLARDVDTQKIQDALIDLTGGDMRLNYTEQKIISQELGVPMSDVRHAFKTYGFEAPNPTNKRIASGFAAAAPVAGIMTLSYLLSRKHAHAEDEQHAIDEQTATAEDIKTVRVVKTENGEITAVAHAVADDTQEAVDIAESWDVKTALAHAVVDKDVDLKNFVKTITNETTITPGQLIELIDEETGKKIMEQLNGTSKTITSESIEEFINRFHLFAEDTQEAKAVAHAIAEAHAVAHAHAEDWDFQTLKLAVTACAEATASAKATATARAEAYSKSVADVVARIPLGSAALAPVLAFVAGFAKTPNESSAVKRGVDTQKMADYVEVYRKSAGKQFGGQITQMPGQITGDEALDRALIVAVLDHDIGSQNTTPTKRELDAALRHLYTLRDEAHKIQPAPTPTPVEECGEAEVKPEEKEIQEEVNTPNTVYKLGKGETLASVIAAKYGIKDPAQLKKVIAFIRTESGIAANGIDPKTGKSAIPEIDGLKDAYSFPDKLPDNLGGNKFNPDAKAKTMEYQKDGSGVKGKNSYTTATVYKKDTEYYVTRKCTKPDGTETVERHGPYATEAEANRVKDDMNYKPE